MQKEKIYIFDTTLRDGEQSPGCTMHLNEKLDIAEALENLGVDVIEAGFPAASVGEFNTVKEIAKVLKHTSIAGLARCKKEDIDICADALRDAISPVLHIFIATSDLHLKEKLKITHEECLENIDKWTRYGKTLIGRVEFSFEDASRTPIEFLIKATQTAVSAGADVINIPDTVGYRTPSEMAFLISMLKKNVKGIDDVILSVHCHNDLGLAVSNSLQAISAGARQIECTINGIGERAGNAAMEEVVMAIKTRSDIYPFFTDINTKQITFVSKLVSNVVGFKITPNKAIVGANAFKHASGIHQHGVLLDKSTYEIMNPEDIGLVSNELILSKHSGKHAFRQLIESMGYTLDEEQIDNYFPKYKDIADKKKFVTRTDIEALLSSATKRKVKRIFELEKYEITTYKNHASAEVTLMTDGKHLTERSSGFGPIDAGFKTIGMLTGQNFKLVDFQIHALSEGKDALGEATVKLSNGETELTGKGLSTDVCEASLLAYISATNKLMQEI